MAVAMGESERSSATGLPSRIHTPIHPHTQPTVSVIIPVYNQVDLLERCLASLERQTLPGIEMIVVSDASPEDPAEVMGRYPGARYLPQAENQGYAATNNTGLAAASGRYLLFLNSDTEFPPETLERLVARLEGEPEAGGVTPLHRLPDGSVQRSCYRFPDLKIALFWDSAMHRRNPDHPVIRAYSDAEWDHQSDRWVEHTMTSCLLIRREAYDQIGGMDPNLRLFYNDTDFCLRMTRAGFPIRFVADIEILHVGGASVGTSDQSDARVYTDRYRYFRKWYGWRGGVAVRLALWSRFAYEALAELTHGHFRFAARKIARALRLNRALAAR